MVQSNIQFRFKISPALYSNRFFYICINACSATEQLFEYTIFSFIVLQIHTKSDASNSKLHTLRDDNILIYIFHMQHSPY